VLGILGIVGAGVLLLHGCGPYYLNLSPGTDSGGRVSIATNHAHYRLYESVQVTVRNRLSTPIYTLYFPDYDCSIDLVPERFAAGAWGDGSLGTGCPGLTSRGCCAVPSPCSGPVRHLAEVRQIDPGTAYLQDWHVGDPGVPTPRVPTQGGLYRITLLYSTDRQIVSAQTMSLGPEPTHDQLYQSHGLQVVISATVQVDDDGYRPPPHVTPMKCL
jgi:hypothetical protein